MFMDADWVLLDGNVFANIYRELQEYDYDVFSYCTKLDEGLISQYKFRGLNKYYYLRDEPTSIHVIKRDACPTYEEGLGYGEDKIWGEKWAYDSEWHKRIGRTITIKAMSGKISISRGLGEKNITRFLHRYNWYGRTMPKYIAKTKDIKMLIGMIAYFICIIPIFWPIPFIIGFYRGLKNARFGLDIPFGMGIVEIISAIGISIGLMQWIVGIRAVSRDL